MSGVFDDDEDYRRVPVDETGNRAFGRVWISHGPWQDSVIGYHSLRETRIPLMRS